MSSIKPLTLYSHATGPNPWKVAIILEELGLPYETNFVDMADMKKEPYVKINPNGRAPSLTDPNTNLTLWESGAIIQYLVETYDKEGKISFGGKAPEKYYENQWLQFQMSGQGPYYGQAAWFQHFHSEPLPSASSRYIKEVSRVMGVLDSSLKDKSYLVGDKCTYADLAFVTWGSMVPWIMKGEKLDTSPYPDYERWLGSLMERPAVKKVLEEKTKAASKGH